MLGTRHKQCKMKSKFMQEKLNPNVRKEQNNGKGRSKKRNDLEVIPAEEV